MSEQTLPQGWTTAPLEQVCIAPSQRVPDPDETFTYIDIGSVDRNTKKITEPQFITGKDAPSRARKVVQTGDVLVSMTRPNLNAVALVGDKYDGQIASTGFDVLRPVEIEPRWIFGHVRSQRFIEEMSEKVQGALYPAVKSKDVRDFIIPIPPLNEQKLIADKLDQLLVAVDSCKTRLDTIPGIIKRFRQSVLAAATSGELTADWQEISNEAPPLQKKLGDILKVSSGKFLPAKDMIAEGGVPVFGGNGINGYHNQSTVDEETLVIGRVGYYCGSIHLTPERAWVTDNALIVRHDESQTYKKYLFYALQAVDLRVNDSSTAQPVISGQKIYSLLISIPSLSEQFEIVRRVDALFAIADRLEVRYQDVLNQVNQLTPSLLAKAFRGELVPQDPNDEPAAKLLERIRSGRVVEQQKTAPLRRGRKKLEEAEKTDPLRSR